MKRWLHFHIQMENKVCKECGNMFLNLYCPFRLSKMHHFPGPFPNVASKIHNHFQASISVYYNKMIRKLWIFVTSPRGVTPLYKLYRDVPPPKGMVFEPFWSGNGYRFWSFSSETGPVWFSREPPERVKTFLSFQLQLCNREVGQVTKTCHSSWIWPILTSALMPSYNKASGKV